MKDSKTKPASAYLNPSARDLQTVLSKIEAIERLNKILSGLLEPELRDYCRVANLANGILIVLTANASVATRLRYQVRTLIKRLHQNPALAHIREIQFKVRPAPAPVMDRPMDKSRHREAATPLSDDTALLIADMAQTIDDPRIRAALEKIAKHKR